MIERDQLVAEAKRNNFKAAHFRGSATNLLATINCLEPLAKSLRNTIHEKIDALLSLQSKIPEGQMTDHQAEVFRKLGALKIRDVDLPDSSKLRSGIYALDGKSYKPYKNISEQKTPRLKNQL